MLFNYFSDMRALHTWSGKCQVSLNVDETYIWETCKHFYWEDWDETNCNVNKKVQNILRCNVKGNFPGKHKKKH